MATKWILFVAVFGTLLPVGRRARAIVIYERSSDIPVIGKLVREDANTVIVQIRSADGRNQLREIPRSRIVEILPSVSQQRLEALSPQRPAAYFEYAEELSEKKRDPESLQASMRLYLIAAYLQPEGFGYSSMLGLITLARSPTEERRFRAMAFLLDADHDRGILRQPAGGTQITAQSDEMRARVLALIQSIRRGKSPRVDTLLRDDALKEAFNTLSDGLTYTEAFSLGRDIPPATLHKLLTIELRLTADTKAASATDNFRSWSGDALNDQPRTVPALNLETLTEFDPRLCVYQAGQWRQPRQ